ncbi:putative trans-sulfuration [Hyphodiscus hymeniophilus]|uniref:Trans-sulfuration n=1 Tax=Hyphodiscus hymeniophilus TaxID=353542 RepID=A0A9P6VMH8_9HELO|nr:putative trans-sulfuration [Hyphodiscus hymeniophilus]
MSPKSNKVENASVETSRHARYVEPSYETTNAAGLDLSCLGPATVALHADDPLNVVADVAPPIHVATTFRYPHDPAQLRPLYDRPEPYVLDPTEHVYSRATTHNSSRLEAILGALLHNDSLVYSSGLSAGHALMTVVNPGKISIGAGYHGFHATIGLHQRLAGSTVLPLDCKPEELGEGDLIWLETPVNPTGLAFNIQHLADKAHSRGAYLAVDSTFAPPPLQDPFEQGADFVMHSGTKYIGGHSDLLCGVLSAKDKSWYKRLYSDRLVMGNVVGGLESWLAVRSLRTLELRITRESASAQHLVQALHGALMGQATVKGLAACDIHIVRRVVKEVQHASLQTQDRQDWLDKQMPNGFGPVFSITMQEEEDARKFPSKLQLYHHATSLGGVESLIEWRYMTDNTVDKDLLRLSIGVENVNDLLADLLQGFRQLVKEKV